MALVEWKILRFDWDLVVRNMYWGTAVGQSLTQNLGYEAVHLLLVGHAVQYE